MPLIPTFSREKGGEKGRTEIAAPPSTDLNE